MSNTTQKLGTETGRRITAQAIAHLRRRYAGAAEDADLAWELGNSATATEGWLRTPLGALASEAQLRERLEHVCEDLYRLGKIAIRVTDDAEGMLHNQARNVADMHRLVARNKELVAALSWAEEEMGL